MKNASCLLFTSTDRECEADVCIFLIYPCLFKSTSQGPAKGAGLLLGAAGGDVFPGLQVLASAKRQGLLGSLGILCITGVGLPSCCTEFHPLF